MSELGQLLRNTRKEKNLSLVDLATQTKIQKRYLQSIEEGNYDQLPGKFYARAFIKSYAEAVEMDVDALFEEYTDQIPSVNEQTEESLPPRRKRPKTVSDKQSKLLSVFSKLLVAVFIIGVLVIFYFLIVKWNDGSTESPPQKDEDTFQVPDAQSDNTSPGGDNNSDSNEEEQTDKPGKEPASEPKTEPQQVLTKTESQGASTFFTLSNTNQCKLKLVVENNPSWIEIKKNGPGGKRFVNKTVQAGKTITRDVSDLQKVYVEIGSTSNVKMFINGEPFSYPNNQIQQKFYITFQPGA